MTAANVLDILEERGFVKDASDLEGLRRALERPIAVYCGYDATAESLHVGNQMGLMALAWLQRFGHRPIALMGGGTTMVGDPSGKSAERPMLTREAIEENVARLKPQLEPFVRFDQGGLLLNNADWLLDLRLVPFLRDIGSRFTINHMLAHETYRMRLEQGGLSFLEFSYQLLQGYDFLHLFRTQECLLQLGGSDQWANILAGVDLIRRMEGVQAFALVTPLLTTAGGQKMGKSEQGAVWLNPQLLSPYEYFQFWMNVEDADVERFLAIYTFLPMEKVRELGALKDADVRQAKEILAVEVTAIVHGRAEAETALATSRALFSGEGEAADAPTTDISKDAVGGGLNAVDLLTEMGLVSSRREARRLIDQGGLSIGGKPVASPDESLVPAYIQPDSESALLRVGKKRYRRVRFV